jgi:hypothetical protein
MGWGKVVVRSAAFGALALVLSGSFAKPVSAQQKAQASNINLVGYDDLQGRKGYLPVVQKQGDRWIAYIGHHPDNPLIVNPLTGQPEVNGTSVVDVTDPRHPKYIAHIPGTEQGDESTGAASAVTCSGSELPHADKSKFYLLRSFGGLAWEMWDVTNPAAPNRLNVIVSGMRGTHKATWECDTGIAYLSGGPLDWPMPTMPHPGDAIDHALIYDLSNPANPVFIRTFGLPGQNSGTSAPTPPTGLHGVASTGVKGNRVYFTNGNAGSGIVEIVDREKLLNGPKEPTDENLRYPVVGRIDLPADIGSQMSFPLIHMQLPEFAKQKEGSLKDFLAVIGEGHSTTFECHDIRQMVRLFDITTESKPVGVSTWTVPEASGNFCSGGYFGTHGSNENFTPIYYNRILFIAHHNAGLRALDIRDPYNPTEIGYYIPAATDKTGKSCVGKGADQHCKIAIDTSNVDVDERGYIYIVDQQDTGMHILELTGAARKLADFSKAEGQSGKR